jgi:alkylation response protein AidB-like acyl-CoA dehydrogenase
VTGLAPAPSIDATAADATAADATAADATAAPETAAPETAAPATAAGQTAAGETAAGETSLAGRVAAALGAGRAAAGPDTPFVVARSAALDEREAFPAPECAVLDACGVAAVYVPAALGGDGGGLPLLVETLRAVSGRDLTVAVAHVKTFLGGVCVWVSGHPDQRRRLARLILDGAVVSWGLTERGRGSDLLAGQLSATPVPGGGWRLDGEKWLINNATRGRLICLLARTSPAGGPRGFSLFLVDKHRLPPGTWRCLPAEPTHGIRGADISGIAFDGAEVPADALVGPAGSGVETVLLALQLTRIGCVSLSLGAGDHALRLAMEMAGHQRLRGTRLLSLPYVRRTLGRAAASLALAETTATVAARCAHALPGETSVVSSVAKACVPDLVQSMIAELVGVLGASAFRTDGPAEGAFQKLERDHRIVPIFDGSTPVNRNALINQFPALVDGHRAGRVADAAGLGVAADPTVPVPDLDTGRLSLVSRTGCSVVQAVPGALRRLAARAAADGGAAARMLGLARRLCEVTDEVVTGMAGIRPSARSVPAEAFALAQRYELCFAGAAAVHRWLALPPASPAGLRAEVALARAVQLLDPGRPEPADALAADLLTTLEARGSWVR